MRRSLLLPLVGLAMAVLAGGALASAPDIVGTWVGKTEIPEAGLDEVTMVLTKAETGYAGTASDTLGYLAPSTELKDVKLEGSELSYTFPLVDGQTVVIRLTVEGEKMTGAWTTSEGSTGSITFEKKK
ncbi:MAG: hypothetical protein FJY80_06560 [Candidatus Aminicenantes bacterium]|nr:hypothetical protein [Candidatus Aminicenantes bacterium]